MSKKVFLSWSGNCAREMARSMKTQIEYFFKSAVDVYFSIDNEPGERGVEQVITALRSADIVIYIFTKESAISEWVLYEFAYARALRDANKSGGYPKLLPLIAPTVDIGILPKPIRDEGNQLIRFSRGGVEIILNVIADSISSNEIYKEKIASEMEEQYKLIELEFNNHINDYPHDDTIYNTVIDPNHIVHVLDRPQESKEQFTFPRPPSESSISLSEIPEIFANYVENIPNRTSFVKTVPMTGDLLRIAEAKGFKEHHQIWFNDTRIANFVVITDGDRILLHNRHNDSKQRVKNDRKDCFGAVEFENWTLLMKISGKRSHDIRSISFNHIPVVAYENILVSTLTRPRSYLCMMFGYEFVISKEDFDVMMLENQKPSIRMVTRKEFVRMKDDALTSKAQAYKDFLFNSMF